MPEEMHEVTDHSIFAYPDEVIVELRGRTADGEFTSVTYQFEWVGNDEVHIRPRDAIDDAHKDTIKDAMAETEYKIESE